MEKSFLLKLRRAITLAKVVYRYSLVCIIFDYTFRAEDSALTVRPFSDEEYKLSAIVVNGQTIFPSCSAVFILLPVKYQTSYFHAKSWRCSVALLRFSGRKPIARAAQIQHRPGKPGSQRQIRLSVMLSYSEPSCPSNKVPLRRLSRCREFSRTAVPRNRWQFRLSSRTYC